MTVFLALLTILVPASVTLAGFMIKKSTDMRASKQQQDAKAQRALEREQSEKRLAQEREQSEKRLAQEHEQSEKRLAQGKHSGLRQRVACGVGGLG